MCGIFGVMAHSAGVSAIDDRRLSDILAHRGPDDSGAWRDESDCVLLGHRRLAVVDLSATGHQPMRSAGDRFILIFNGEIYNHEELRAILGNRSWRGSSDTETLLACITEWGIEKTLRATVGMFACAIWDQHAQRLVLARDRMGEKPLYYGFVAGRLAFASELKALRALPGFSAEVDRSALAAFMRYNYVPAPLSIFRGVAKLPPGTWLELSRADVAVGQLPEPRAYWSAIDNALAGSAQPMTFLDDDQAADALEAVLARAVAGQMMSDVPLGAFLSGGIDSSTIVSLMQAQSSHPVKTFSIGFDASGFNEAQHAKAVANHIGTDHTELYVTPEDALAVIPKLPTIYDEPFADSSQIPTYLVAAMARAHVTVVLSGDGGDELFGGYTRYSLAAALWRQVATVPKPLRRGLASAIRAVPPSSWDGLMSATRGIVPRILRISGDRLHKAAVVLESGSIADLYGHLTSHWVPDTVVLDAVEPVTPLSAPWPPLRSLTEQMMALDSITYLPDDILVKVDRAAMAVSLETRVPLLDHRVFEFAWHLPMQYKVRDGVGKWLLRRVLHRYVPRELIERPKMGFAVPIDSWLRGPLREWAEELLDKSRLERSGYFDAAVVRAKWCEHLSGRRNWKYQLWDVLMFQAWAEHWL